MYDDSAALDRLSRRLTDPAARGAGFAPSVDVYCVYRARNASTVAALIADLPAGSRVHLHALDAPAEALAAWTRAHGPGARSRLHQALIDAHAPRAGSPLMLVDDDVVFTGPSVADFIALVQRFALDVAQPAHDRMSHTSHPFNHHKRFTLARETRFVETGPLVLFSEKAKRALFPIPDDIQMGYGLDVWWSSRREPDGLRLGIIDGTPINHTGAVRADYAPEAEWALLEDYLAREGATDMHHLLTETGRRWWVGRPCPPRD